MSIVLALAGFILGMLVLVTVHEFGHYWVAKKLGVKILRFSVGFGKPLLLWRHGPDKTEWVIAAIPLGGFVRMLDEQEGSVPEHDLPRAFNRQPLWKRTLIVLAGPVANLLLAFVLYAGMLMWGVPQLSPKVHSVQAHSIAESAGFKGGETVLQIDDEPVSSWADVEMYLLLAALENKSTKIEVDSASQGVSFKQFDFSSFDRKKLTQNFSRQLGLSVTPVKPGAAIGRVVVGSPAEKAGIMAGDEIVAINNNPVQTFDQVADFVGHQPNSPIAITVQRQLKQLTLSVQPELIRENGKEIPRIGVELGAIVDQLAYQRLVFTQRLGLWDASVKAWQQGRISTRLTLKMLAGMLSGDVSTSNISGPVGIATIAGDSIKAGVPSFVAFLVIMSLSLGIMNLLPIPVLDGGHLVYYLIEAIAGKPLSERTLLIAQRLGIALLGLLTLLAFYNDFYRLLSH